MQFECQLNFQCKKLLKHILFYIDTPLYAPACARAHQYRLYPAYLHSHLHQICCGSTYTWTLLLSLRDPEEHLWRVFLKQVRAHRVWREAHHLKASVHLLYIGVYAWSRRIFEKGTDCTPLLSELPDLGLSPGRIKRQFSTRTSSHRDDTWEIR